MKEILLQDLGSLAEQVHAATIEKWQPILILTLREFLRDRQSVEEVLSVKIVNNLANF